MYLKTPHFIIDISIHLGYINKPLLNPAPTMREYFWLWIIFIAENLVALAVEAVNGGVWTSQVMKQMWSFFSGGPQRWGLD